MCYFLTVDCVKNILFSKRESWFILGDTTQGHKFPVEWQKAVQQGVKIQGAWQIFNLQWIISRKCGGKIYIKKGFETAKA